MVRQNVGSRFGYCLPKSARKAYRMLRTNPVSMGAEPESRQVRGGAQSTNEERRAADVTPVHWPNGALGSLVLNEQQQAATQHHSRILDTFFRRDTAIEDCPDSSTTRPAENEPWTGSHAAAPACAWNPQPKSRRHRRRRRAPMSSASTP